MKQSFILLALIFFSISSIAQKVNINNQRIKTEFASMPTHYIDSDMRTFSLNVDGSYKFDKQKIANDLNLRGWTYVAEGGTVTLNLNIADFVRGKSTSSSRTEESKNKEGKVTSRTTYYSYSSSNSGLASMKVYGPKNEMKKEVKKKKEANPFLSSESASETTRDSEYLGEFDLSLSYAVSGGESKDRKTAYNSYISKSNEMYAKQKVRYTEDVIARANKRANALYGYNKIVDPVKFKKIKSKKHPEFKMFNQANEALAQVLAEKKFNKPFAHLVESVQPMLEYYTSIAEKYSSKDKHHKKLKAACLYNIAQINYCLDLHDETIKIGQEYLSWGHDSKDGEKFIEKSTKMSKTLAFHKSSGRYFETAEDSQSIEVATIPEVVEE